MLSSLSRQTIHQSDPKIDSQTNLLSAVQFITVRAVRCIFSKWKLAFQQWRKRGKIHSFQSADKGAYFCLEENPDCPGWLYLMIAYKDDVQRNDLIRIQDDSNFVTYRILDIDFYSDFPSIWIANLEQASPTENQYLG